MENLMQPRFKVIADYPGSWYSKGDVLTGKPDHAPQEGFVAISMAEKYSDIYKPLKWWEEREVSEMPDYLKIDSGICLVGRYDIEDNTIYLKTHPHGCGGLGMYPFSLKTFLNRSVPATKEEYEAGKT